MSENFSHGRERADRTGKTTSLTTVHVPRMSEKETSPEVCYKAGDLSGSSGGWEDDIALVWKGGDLTYSAHFDGTHTHTLRLILI